MNIWESMRALSHTFESYADCKLEADSIETDENGLVLEFCQLFWCNPEKPDHALFFNEVKQAVLKHLQRKQMALWDDIVHSQTVDGIPDKILQFRDEHAIRIT